MLCQWICEEMMTWKGNCLPIKTNVNALQGGKGFEIFDYALEFGVK